MARFFISYSSKHRELTRRLAEVIEAAHGAGSVWWDTELKAGDQFNPEITKELDAAEAVIVVWTDGAVQSAWVYAEAVRASAQRKVVTVREASLDPGRIPMPFNVFHADAVDELGLGHRALLDAIEKRIAGEASPLPNELPSTTFRNFLVDPKQEGLPPWAAAKRPAALLLAKHRLVEYDDIHGIVAEMVKWATEQPAHAMGSPVLGRLVHGPGGLGKTRALIEVAEVLAKEHGWLAGFVPRGVREEAKAAMEALIARGDAPGLLLVLDYAEGRQDDAKWLAERLVARALTVQKPARLVLLSRGAGDWWKSLLITSQALQDLTSMGGDCYDERAIPERIARGDRLAMFDRASASFLDFRRRQEPAFEAPPPPSDALAAQIDDNSDFDRPLAVQIAGLLHALGYDAGDNRSGMAGLLEKVLGLEYEHWEKTLALDPNSNWPQAIRNGVAQVTVTGGVDDKAAAEGLLGRDPLFDKASDIDVPRAVERLGRIFPGGGTSFAALEPDLIGEHHVAETADDALVDACLDWASGDEVKTRAILTVLNRATRAEHGAAAAKAGRQLARLIERRGSMLAADLVTAGVSTPGKLLTMLPGLQAVVAALDEEALDRLSSALPEQSLALMDLASAARGRQVLRARANRRSDLWSS